MSSKKVRLFLILVFFLISLAGDLTDLYAGNTGIDGFNGLFFRPNADNLGILNVDRSSVHEPGIISLGSYFQYARRTISFSDPALSGLTTDMAENQVVMDLTLGIGLFKFLDVGMDIPIVLMQNGTRCNDATCGSVTNYTGHALGDIRFVAKLELMRDEKSKIGIALASDVGIPTGDRKLFTGGKGASYEQRLILSKGFKYIDITANAGYRAVGRVEAIGIDYDDMATFGVAVKGHLPKQFFAYATVVGARLITDNSDANTPVEIMAGVGHSWKNGISCQIAGGTHIHDGIGAADYRTVGSCGISFDPLSSIKKKYGPKDVKDLSPIMEWTVLFNSNQSWLSSKQKDGLDDVIRWLAIDRKRRVKITGSADDRALFDYNIRLSKKRALSVFDYLTRNGVPQEQLLIKIYGEMSPRSTGKTGMDRSVNRTLIIRELREGDE